MNVKVIESERIYHGDITLRKDKFSVGERVVEKVVVEHKNSVGIVAVSADEVILVTQYRRAAERILLEIPAGKIEKNETPKRAAIREMAEEIGYSGRLKELTKWYLAPGYSTELMHIFLATNLKKIPRGTLDDDENISVKKIKINSAIRKCLSGEIRDSKTVAALLTYGKLCL